MPTDILYTLFNDPECNIQDDGLFWILTIDELEILLDTAANNSELFESIIEWRKNINKVEYDSFSHAFSNNGIKGNNYLKKAGINKYRNIIDDYINQTSV